MPLNRGDRIKYYIIRVVVCKNNYKIAVVQFQLYTKKKTFTY